MTGSDTSGGTSDETTRVIPEKGWSRKDILLIMVVLLMRLGEGVELYLPGVITQQVSCELGVTPFQEGVLGVILYVTLTLSVAVTGSLSDRIGRKLVILISLYTAILFTVFCAIVPNYYTLLLSRALNGLCLGLSSSTLGVYFAESVSSRDLYTRGTALGGLCIAAGGGWITLLAYLLLDLIGWRGFVVITSLPFFIPPIIILHCYLEDSAPGRSSIAEIGGGTSTTVVNYTLRVIRISIFLFINMLQGHGTIILLPALLRMNNKDLNVIPGEQHTSCIGTVHGSQLLLLGAVQGVMNILGRVAGYLVSGRVNFRVVQSCLAFVITLSYGMLLCRSELVATVVAIGIVKLVYSMMMLQLTLLIYDPGYFGWDKLAAGSAIAVASGCCGSAIGNAFAAFLKPQVAVIITFVFSILQIGVACSFNDI